MRISKSHDNKKSLNIPVHEINKKCYLNDISMKYRYTLMEINRINQNLGKTNGNGNLFKRLGHVGHNLDKDIKSSMKALNHKGYLSNEGKPIPNKLTSYKSNGDSLNTTLNSDRNQSVANGYTNLPYYNKDNISKITGIEMNISPYTKIFQQYEPVLTELELSTEDLKRDQPKKEKKVTKVPSSFSPQHKPKYSNNLKLKGVNIKLVDHPRRFLIFSKKPENDEELTYKKKNLPLNKLQAKNKNINSINHNEKRSIVLNSSETSSYCMNNSSYLVSPENKVLPNSKFEINSHFEEYEKINYDGSGNVRLIKNFLIPPLKKRSNSEYHFYENNSSKIRLGAILKTYKGLINISKLLSPRETGFNFNSKSNEFKLQPCLRLQSRISLDTKQIEKECDEFCKKEINQFLKGKISKYSYDGKIFLPQIEKRKASVTKNEIKVFDKEYVELLDIKDKNDKFLQDFENRKKSRVSSIIENHKDKLANINNEITGILSKVSSTCDNMELNEAKIKE